MEANEENCNVATTLNGQIQRPSVYKNTKIKNGLKTFDKTINLSINISKNLKKYLDNEEINGKRRFFKQKLEQNADNDVSKVYKWISSKRPGASEKKTLKSVLKTYSNKKRIYTNSDIVESFGLPDEPIIPLHSPSAKPIRNKKIDIDMDEKNVNTLDIKYEIDDWNSPNVQMNDVIITEIKDKIKQKLAGTSNNRNRQSLRSFVFTESVEVKKEIKKQLINSTIDLDAIEAHASLDDMPVLERQNEPTMTEIEIPIKPIVQRKNLSVKNVESLLENNEDYNVGDLAWAKIGTYPYWPSLIIKEPISGNHKKYHMNRVQPIYHVRFFGDNGRRAWVNSLRLIHYSNHDDLERIKVYLKAEKKMKQNHVEDHYSVKPNKLPKWTIAVSEAEELRIMSLEKRVECFDKLLNKQQKKSRTNNNLTITDTVVKNESSNFKQTNEQENLNEPPKLDHFIHESMYQYGINTPIEMDEDKPKTTLINLIEEKSLVEINSNNSTKIEKKIVNRKFKNLRKRLNISMDENEDINYSVRNTRKRKTVREIERNSKRIKLEILNGDLGKTNSGTSTSDSTKFSDNSLFETTIQSQEALNKRNNIFKKIRKDKLCELCGEDGSNWFKCKGGCFGVYHSKCIQEFNTKIVINLEQKNDSNVEIITIEPKNHNESTVIGLDDFPSFDNLSLADKIDLKMKQVMEKIDNTIIDVLDSPTFSEMSDNDIGRKGQSIIKHVTADDVSYISMQNDQIEIEQNNDICFWCRTNTVPPCMICRKNSSIRVKCLLPQCGKYYHVECLKLCPQTQWTFNSKSNDNFICPRHFCHTCMANEPTSATTRSVTSKLVRCLHCSATYHKSNHCVPAGSIILSATQIVCPRHYPKTGKRNHPINTNWCFICSEGGNLICCETCPACVHSECMQIELNDDENYICEDCQSGRLPLYDEVVWVKLGTYRWWPAVILYPNEIPINVKNMPHNPDEFVVKFFGTYNHYWVNGGRSFLFQEGDSGHVNSVRKRVDNNFIKAVEEATIAHQLKKQFKLSIGTRKGSTRLKPPPYIRIRVNKPVGNVRLFDGNISNTTSCECDPTDSHPCGPDSNCLNRLLLTECNPEVCPAGQRCNNQCFEKRVYPPLTPYLTETRGWGLKTLAPLRKGQFIIEYVGEMIDEQEYQRRIIKMHEQKTENYYFLTIDRDRMLDAGPKGNMARFMNHSCQPNCETQKWTVNGSTRVGLFAKEDIMIDTELTFNYNLECIGKEKKICHCGAPNCSGFIGVKAKSIVEREETALIKRPKKLRKKKSAVGNNRIQNEEHHYCFICRESGELGRCNNQICDKYYHLKCVGLTEWPRGGKWTCSWHTCNFCTKRTIRCCVLCLNSYCPAHSIGYIKYHPTVGFLCSQDDLEMVTTQQKEQIDESPRTIPSTSGQIKKEEKIDTNVSEEVVGEKSESVVNDDVNVPESCSSNTINKITKKGKSKTAKKNDVKSLEKLNKNTANIKYSMENEVKLSNYTPAKYLRTKRSSTDSMVIDKKNDLEKDLPIRKRASLRRENDLAK